MGKDINVLVSTNHLIRYMQVLVTTSQTAQCTAKGLWNIYIAHYGLPLAIISDQGRKFKSDLTWEMCELTQVCKLCTTPHHLQGNGQCKCFNSTLISIIGMWKQETSLIGGTLLQHWCMPTIVHVIMVPNLGLTF